MLTTSASVTAWATTGNRGGVTAWQPMTANGGRPKQDGWQPGMPSPGQRAIVRSLSGDTVAVCLATNQVNEAHEATIASLCSLVEKVASHNKYLAESQEKLQASIEKMADQQLRQYAALASHMADMQPTIIAKGISDGIAKGAESIAGMIAMHKASKT